MAPTVDKVSEDSTSDIQDKTVTRRIHNPGHKTFNRRHYRWGYHQYHRGQYRSTFRSYRHKHRCQRNSAGRNYDNKKWLCGILQMQMQINLCPEYPDVDYGPDINKYIKHLK